MTKRFCASIKDRLPDYFSRVFVLDAGSANSDHNALFEESLYLGADIAEGHNVDLICSPHELDLPSDTFDVVMGTGCFEGDPQCAGTIRNLSRMLKPGGLFLFSCTATEKHVHQTLDLDTVFASVEVSVSDENHEVYFVGIKRGEHRQRANHSFLTRTLPLADEVRALRRLVASHHEDQEERLKLRVDHERLSAKLEQLSGTLDGMGEENRRLRQEGAETHQTLEQVRLELDSLSGSWSWRVTGPLRWIKNGLAPWWERSRGAASLGVRALRYLGAPGNLAKEAQALRGVGLRGVSTHLRESVAAAARNGVQQRLTSHEISDFNLRSHSVVYILTTRHCSFIAHLMVRCLEKVGIQGKILYERPVGGYAQAPHFVICPHMFTELPELFVAFQMEQSVSSRWFGESYWNVLRSACAVFDYSITNIQFFQKNGLGYGSVYYLPIGYCPNYLGQATDEDYEPYDVLFYGDVNSSRRRRFIDVIKRRYRVRIIHSLFGEALYSELRKAKLVVNIHYYENALLETTRIYECLSMHRLVISEKAADLADHPSLEGIVDFVDVGDVDGMLRRIDYWLSDYRRRHEKVRANRQLLESSPNPFEYYFLRFLLASDNLEFEEFYRLAGSHIRFEKNFICLGLPESVERRATFEKDNVHGIQYFPGLRHRLGWVGCGLSYKFIMRKAEELGFDQILVCEDDVEFLEGWQERLATIRSYLAKHPEDWDLFSGLIADLHRETQVCGVHEHHGMKFAHIDKMTSTVMNIYNRTFYPRLAQWDEKNHDANSNTIDRFIESRSGVRVVTTLPFLVGHKEELSSTLWGFNNGQYRSMIERSSALLSEMTAQHGSESRTEPAEEPVDRRLSARMR